MSVTSDVSATPNAIAISLGWRCAEIYSQDSYAIATKAEGETLPRHLPGIYEMSEGQKAIALLHQIESDVVALRLNVPPGRFGTIRDNINTPAPAETIKQQIHDLFISVRDDMAATKPDQATALGLGRMLADTTLRPTSTDAGTFTAAFRPRRLQNAYDWLDELAQTLPVNSAKTVRQSLGSWAAWVGRPKFESRRQNRAVGPDHSIAFDRAAVLALRLQGDLWRRLLSGEQVPEQLLDPEAYVQAGLRMIDRLRRISVRFLRRWWIPALVLVTLLGVAGFFIIRYLPAVGSSQSVAIVVSAFAALGVTWKGIGSTLGKALNEAQRPLWDAEVLEALSIAATRLPPGSKTQAAGILSPPPPITASQPQSVKWWRR